MSLWGNRDSKTASGTIYSIDEYGNVVGSGTSFTTEAKIGNTIYTDGTEYLITTITDNTHCTVRPGMQGGEIDVGASYSYTLSEKPAFVAASESGDTSGDSGDSREVYGVDAIEVHSGGDNLINIAIIDGGNKYRENQLVFATDTSNTPSVGYAIADPATGKLTSVVVLSTGNGFDVAPAIVTFGAHYTIGTGDVEDDAANQIYLYNHPLETGDYVRYLRRNGNAIEGYTDTPDVEYIDNDLNNTLWYVRKNNNNNFSLYNTLQGALGTGTNPENHKLIIDTHGNSSQRIMLANDGDTKNTAADNKATFVATLGSGDDGEGGNAAATVTHAGWVRRTIGTGGRAGRVFQETLVAMGSITGDQADDRRYPDA